MNVFNRVLVVLLLLGLIAVLVVGVVLPAACIAWLRAVAAGADVVMVVPGAYIHLGVTAALLVLCLVLLVLEMRQPRRLTVKVRQAGGGTVELGTESIARSLEYNVGQIPGVVKARPVVVSQGKSVKVALDLELDPTADLRAKSEEVMQLARDLVEGKLGLKLSSGGLRVNVRQAPYTQHDGGPKPEPPASQLPPTEPPVPLTA